MALLVEMDARSAAARLTDLAERDDRCSTSGIWDDTVWQDEQFQRELWEAAAALSDEPKRTCDQWNPAR
ncbi:hypothetical protein [Dactylosporangium sp. NPDC005555]|uniref:hypothetical protein n=1 Tax=Dactylosporangium sp. NPDC005555 TaxID=3154889 RepID=UPI0033A921CC